MARKQVGSAASGSTDTPTKAYVDSAQNIAVNAQTGTTYTLVLADAGKAVELTNAAATTVTVPPNASVAFPIGTIIELDQLGAGQVTIVAGSGVTLRSAGSLAKTRLQFSAVSLRKQATDIWLLVGDLA